MASRKAVRRAVRNYVEWLETAEARGVRWGVTCSQGLPTVLVQSPFARDRRYENRKEKGVRPFPTLYWQACPVMAAKIDALEGAGGVKHMDHLMRTDAGLRAELQAAHQAYARERDAVFREVPAAGDEEGGDGAGGTPCAPSPGGATAGDASTSSLAVDELNMGGVGGIRGEGVKCLHVHYAHHAMSGPNPVGAWVSRRLGGAVQCSSPCVVRWGEGGGESLGWSNAGAAGSSGCSGGAVEPAEKRGKGGPGHNRKAPRGPKRFTVNPQHEPPPFEAARSEEEAMAC